MTPLRIQFLSLSSALFTSANPVCIPKSLLMPTTSFQPSLAGSVWIGFPPHLNSLSIYVVFNLFGWLEQGCDTLSLLLSEQGTGEMDHSRSPSICSLMTDTQWGGMVEHPSGQQSHWAPCRCPGHEHGSIYRDELLGTHSWMMPLTFA